MVHAPVHASSRTSLTVNENRLNLKLWEVSGAAKNTHVVSAA